LNDTPNFSLQNSVLKVFEIWVGKHWHDFGLNSLMQEELSIFIQSVSEIPEFKEHGHRIQKLIEKEVNCSKQNSILSNETDFFVLSKSDSFEAIINDHALQNTDRRGKAMESMIFDMTPEDISQQLCLHNFNLFKNVHPVEVLNQIWTKNDDSISPSLDFFIIRFDKESYWTATEIVKVTDIKKRTTVLKNFILTAKVS
jgi:hypothetical protein